VLAVFVLGLRSYKRCPFLQSSMHCTALHACKLLRVWEFKSYSDLFNVGVDSCLQ
jgi:hypothetical protein